MQVQSKVWAALFLICTAATANGSATTHMYKNGELLPLLAVLCKQGMREKKRLAKKTVFPVGLENSL